MADDVSIAELARQVREVLSRFQGLADRLDTSYVSKEVFELYRRSIEQTLKSIQDSASNMDRDKAEKTSSDDVIRRVTNMEDNLKWLVRLVMALIVVAVVGLVVTGGGK